MLLAGHPPPHAASWPQFHTRTAAAPCGRRGRERRLYVRVAGPAQTSRCGRAATGASCGLRCDRRDQRDGHAIGPRVDVRPVAIVAQAAPKGLIEHPRRQGPLLAADHPREDAVVPRPGGLPHLVDATRLARHEAADDAAAVPEGADAEEPEGA